MAENDVSANNKEGTKQLDELKTSGCGCGPCKPSWANRFANPKLFTLHTGILMGVLVMTITYFGGVLSTIERSFQISSTASGALAVISDIVQLSLVFVVAYFAHSSHRPRVIGVGTIIFGIGQFLCAVPHYVSTPLDPESVIHGSSNFPSRGISGGGLCVSNRSVPNDTRACNGHSDHQGITLGPIVWLILGRIVTGIGTSCLWAQIMSYLDDGVGKHKLTSYTGNVVPCPVDLVVIPFVLIYTFVT